MTANVQVAESVSQNGVPNRVRGSFMMLKHCGKIYASASMCNRSISEVGACELHHMSALAKLRAVAAHIEILGDFGEVFFVLNTVTCQMRIFDALNIFQAEKSS